MAHQPSAVVGEQEFRESLNKTGSNSQPWQNELMVSCIQSLGTAQNECQLDTQQLFQRAMLGDIGAASSWIVFHLNHRQVTAGDLQAPDGCT